MRSEARISVQSFEAMLTGKSVEWPQGASGAKIAPSELDRVRAFEARVPPLRIVAPPRRDAAPVWHLVVHLSGRGAYRIRAAQLNSIPARCSRLTGERNARSSIPMERMS